MEKEEKEKKEKEKKEKKKNKIEAKKANSKADKVFAKSHKIEHPQSSNKRKHDDDSLEEKPKKIKKDPEAIESS